MAGSNTTRRTPNTRKPVTIDLEAKKVEADEVPVDTTSTVTDSVDLSSGDNQSAEPVAFDELADKKSKEAQSSEAASNQHDEPSANDDAPVAKQSNKSGSGALMGGLIGGLIALLGVGGLQWANVLPSFGNAPAQTVDTTVLETDIQSLKSQIAKLEEEAASTPPAGVSPDVEAQLSAASIAFEEASTRVGVIEQSVTDLGAQVETLKSAAANGEASEAGSVSVAVSEQLSGLTEQLAGLEANIAQQDEKISAAETALNEQINTLESRVVKVEEVAAEGGTNANVATAIASAGLKSAIDRGGSFMAELEAFATVSQNGDVVDGLRDYAAAGVPTINQLSDEFSSVANKIVATGQGLDENASVTDRLMQSARSLVQVRPVGEVEGETPGAIAARIETRLKSGDLAGALAQWDTLPEAAKNVSAAFAEKMRARQSVDELVAKALTGAMATTSTN